MDVRLLGPVEVRVTDQHVGLGPPQQRCVFAVLAMTPGQTVPVDVLVNRVWGEQVPRNVRTILYTYVSRLRGLLATGDRTAQPAVPRVLRHRDGGYALELSPEQIDLHRARQLASRARAAGGQPGGDELAAALLAEADAHWTGSPLTGINGEWADRVRVGLDHERLALQAERFEAALRVGEDEAMVGPLSHALAANPLTESLAGLLMLALHRTGRHADALAVYGRLRRRMVEELGDEPGPALQRLHEQMLRRDQALEAPGTLPIPMPPPPVAEVSVPQPPAPWLPLCQLPPSAWHFVGRDDLITRLLAALAPDGSAETVPVALLTGAPGVGKTALATEVAQRARDRFPDGQWYVSLGGVASARDPAQVAAELLEATGIAAHAAIPIGLERRTAALRARLAHRKVLLLLDDAADVAQVRPLLPGTPGAAVLVTSQRMLSGLAAATSVRLGPLPEAEAVELLGRLAGGDRLAREPAATAEVCAALGGLPLALRIVGARLAVHPEWTIARLAARLRDRNRRLDELSVDDLAVRPSLELSYQALDQSEQAAFRWLGLLGGHDVAAWTVGVLVGGDGPGGGPSDGERVVEGLVAASLLENAGVDAAGEPRYRLHELVAAYAAELAEQDPPEHGQLLATIERARALGRHQQAALLTERRRYRAVRGGYPTAAAAIPHSPML